MKRIKTNSLVALAALTVAATQLFTAAPASAANYKQADKTSASIAEFRDEILNIKKEVDATLVALDKVVATADKDPRKAFQEFQMGYAAALAWVLFLIILALTVFVVRSGRWWVYYEGERR